jgi:hypothetical protein
MKTLITKIATFGSLALLMLASCKKEGTLVAVNTSNTTAATLTASTTTPALVKANLTQNAVTFTSTAPNYGYSAAVGNTLQFDVKGDNFATPKKEVTLGAGVLSQSYNVQDLNNILLAMNLPTGVSAQVEVRVKSSLSSTAGIVYSNVVTLTATPFALVSYVYVPGAYQGWDPTKADSLQSATGNGVYTGIINFVGTDMTFKITPAKKWDVSYGDAGSGKISTSGGNLTAPAAGQYLVTLDLNANTITMVKADYYSLIGDADIDWNTDVDMKFNNGVQLWTLTAPLKSTGGFKIRKNHDWGTSYGFPSPLNGGVLTSSNGANLTVSVTGTYALTFIVSTTDATVANYTAVKQ